MSKIYDTADNHHVKATVIYCDNNYKLYRDPELNDPFYNEDRLELLDLFISGVIIRNEEWGVYYKPTSFSDNGVECYFRAGSDTLTPIDYIGDN